MEGSSSMEAPVAKYTCHDCKEAVPVTDLRWLQCGHVICAESFNDMAEAIKTGSMKCLICKKPAKADHFRSIPSDMKSRKLDKFDNATLADLKTNDQMLDMMIEATKAQEIQLHDMFRAEKAEMESKHQQILDQLVAQRNDYQEKRIVTSSLLQDMNLYIQQHDQVNDKTAIDQYVNIVRVRNTLQCRPLVAKFQPYKRPPILKVPYAPCIYIGSYTTFLPYVVSQHNSRIISAPLLVIPRSIIARCIDVDQWVFPLSTDRLFVFSSSVYIYGIKGVDIVCTKQYEKQKTSPFLFRSITNVSYLGMQGKWPKFAIQTGNGLFTQCIKEVKSKGEFVMRLQADFQDKQASHLGSFGTNSFGYVLLEETADTMTFKMYQSAVLVLHELQFHKHPLGTFTRHGQPIVGCEPLLPFSLRPDFKLAFSNDVVFVYAGHPNNKLFVFGSHGHQQMTLDVTKVVRIAYDFQTNHLYIYRADADSCIEQYKFTEKDNPEHCSLKLIKTIPDKCLYLPETHQKYHDVKQFYCMNGTLVVTTSAHIFIL
jgi:hypothetical protein